MDSFCKALGWAGRTIEYAVEEGKTSCESKNLTAAVKMLKR
jgi:hypothetical protein